METTVQNNQSLLDIALITHGSADAAFDIALENGLSVTDELPSGTVLEFPMPEKSKIAEYYAINDIKPATGLDAQTITDLKEGTRFFEEEFDNYFE
jgi:hypothetical protein